MKFDWNKIKALPWARIGLIALCVFLSLVLIVMITATVYIENIFSRIGRVTGEEETYPSELITQATLPSDFTGVTINPSDVTTAPGVSNIIAHKDIVNIMLVGQDRREGENYRTRSDAMILCTFNIKDYTITMTSFMRDMYVQIPGYGGDKMNAAYAYGGMKLLRETMMANFGVQVDAFVEVDFSGFKAVVNTLGGVDIYLTAAEANYMNTTAWDGLDYEGWTLTEGMNHLNGDQALAYSRIRYVGGTSDFGRTERQRKVLSTILSSCKNMSWDTAYALLNNLLPLVATDMTNSEILGYATQLFPLLSKGDLVTQRIPIDGSYQLTYVGALDVVLPDLEVNREFLLNTLMPKN